MKKRNKNTSVYVVVLLTILLWSVLLHYVSPAQIVALIGTENGYIIMFLVSLLGGLTSLGGTAYVATAITLAAGGLSPVFLALFASAGTVIGDTGIFLVSRYGERYLKDTNIGDKIRSFGNWLSRQSRLVLGFVVYAYTAFTPLPNDVLTIALGLARQPYALVIIALALGNFTFVFLLATFGTVLPF